MWSDTNIRLILESTVQRVRMMIINLTNASQTQMRSRDNYKKKYQEIAIDDHHCQNWQLP